MKAPDNYQLSHGSLKTHLGTRELVCMVMNGIIGFVLFSCLVSRGLGAVCCNFVMLQNRDAILLK